MKKVLSLLLALLLTYGCAAAETLSLSLIGDCTIGDQYKYRGYKSGFTYKISQAGLDYPFSLAADLFAQDDLTIANCEGCFTNRASTGKFMSLGAAPEFAEVFKLGFVDVVNTANNHMRDFGSAGREDTEAVKTMAQLEGIFLDPVYTGKAFACFLEEVRQGAFPGENILFLHSGGAGGLFAVELPE